MFSTKSQVTYGVILDIGSGSVLVAIVASKSHQSFPDIIWSKREYTPQRAGDTSTSAKRVMSALVNVMLVLETEGKPALEAIAGSSKLDQLQVTIAAPWSYTVTKTITYVREAEFQISAELIAELLRTANQKVQAELEENEKAIQFRLQVVERRTVGLMANDYHFRLTNHHAARDLKVVEASAVAQQYLVEAVEEVRQKVLPKANSDLLSFMLAYYFVYKSIQPDLQEACLIDVTYEATEIGLIRNGFLQYCTHIPTGAYTLARNLGEAMNIPHSEAFGRLGEDTALAFSSYSDSQQAVAKSILDSYQYELVGMFKETGDALSIPKKIILHSNLQRESFFRSKVLLAAETATNSSHAVYEASKELIQHTYPKDLQSAILSKRVDTALLISAHFFHIECQSPGLTNQ